MDILARKHGNFCIGFLGQIKLRTIETSGVCHKLRELQNSRQIGRVISPVEVSECSEGSVLDLWTGKLEKQKQRECICIHLGQGGIQSGLAVWELLSIEHSVDHNGNIKFEEHDECKETGNYFNTLPVFFEEKKTDVYVPRAVMVDFESSILDNIRCGYHNLFDLNRIISGKEEAVNFARGYYTLGPFFLDLTLDQIRKAVNECENLQGIFIFHSLGGGTGSGFGSLLMDHISQEFSKKCCFEYAIYPADKHSIFPSVLEPYNYILANDSIFESFNCSYMMDNQTLFNMYNKKVGVDHHPSFKEVNKLVAEVVSATTSPFRFHNALNMNITDFQVNMFPFPKAHFPVVGLAPILKQSKTPHENLLLSKITLEGFEPSSQVMECDLSKGVYMACCLLYRGDIKVQDINSTVDMLKNKKRCMHFIDGCPTGFKFSLNKYSMKKPMNWGLDVPTRFVCIISNNTAISSSWIKTIKKFDSMFNQKAYLHWYFSEGMEEQQFIDAKNTAEALTNEYLNVQKNIPSL